MKSPYPSLSLSELVRLAFPEGTSLQDATPNRIRPIHWVARAGFPLNPGAFERHDVVLVSESGAADGWGEVLSILAQGGASAVGVAAPVHPDLPQAARENGLPLIIWPEGVPVREVERSLLALLLDRQTHLAARGVQIQSRLAKLSLENAGLGAMIRLMGEITGKSILLQDKRLEPLAAYTAATLDEFWPEIISVLSDSSQLPDAMRDRKQAAGTPGPERQSLPGGVSRLVCPIVVKEMARGYLSIVGMDSELDALDELVASQGAAACAVEMAKAKAVSEVEKRLRGDFIDAVLTGSLPLSEGTRWAGRMGYDPEPPHAAVVWTWEGDSHPSLRRLETVAGAEIARVGHHALLRAREAEAIAFCAEEGMGRASNAIELAHAVVRTLNTEFPNAQVSCGIGRPADELGHWQGSYREATQALAMARRLNEPNPLYFGDLSVYRLLFLLEGHPELEAFCQNVLGPILEYEGAADLLDTLAAYFAHHGNLSQTAESLFIHRNTLLYRMERISQIGGFDLNNPETRLAVQLALKARRLLPNVKRRG